MDEYKAGLELATEGMKGINKFQDILQKVFNPKWTRKQTDADMDANERKVKFIRDNPDMDIAFFGDEMHVQALSNDKLLQRAEWRMLSEWVRQERNTEKVLCIASNELETADDVSDEPVDEDWLFRIFSIIKDVSNEDMQLIWGKILSGEIAQPGSFSMRTLDTVRNLSHSEANVFEKLLPFIICANDLQFITAHKNILDKYGIRYSDILTLHESGLLSSNESLTQNYMLQKGQHANFYTESLLAVMEGLTEDGRKVSLNVYFLTKAGRELFSIISHNSNDDYFISVMEEELERIKGNVAISIHRVTEKNNKSITYEREPVIKLL